MVFLVAERTDTNIRKYTTEQLLCAINTSVLISEGLKISVISKKSADQISSLIDSKFHSKDKVSREVLLLELLGQLFLKREIFLIQLFTRGLLSLV